jgi:integrase
MISLPDGFRVVRKKLADGTVKEYHYPPRGPRQSPSAPAQGSVKSLLRSYQISPEYRGLSPITHLGYRRWIDVWDGYGERQVTSITRREVIMFRDAIARTGGNASANQFVRVTSAIMTWAMEREWIVASPAMRIRPLPIGTFPAWSEDQVSKALASFSEPFRRAVVLALHTGQRRADLVTMRWGDIQGPAIRVIQRKTKAPLLIPLSPDLAKELAVWRGDSVGRNSILETARGLPWIPSYLSRHVGLEVARAGLPEGLNLHGLRKLAATRLANAGCSAHEIAAITGHRSLSMVAHYTASADQERMAKSAVLRLQTGSKNR